MFHVGWPVATEPTLGSLFCFAVLVNLNWSESIPNQQKGEVVIRLGARSDVSALCPRLQFLVTFLVSEWSVLIEKVERSTLFEAYYQVGILKIVFCIMWMFAER